MKGQIQSAALALLLPDLDLQDFAAELPQDFVLVVVVSFEA